MWVLIVHYSFQVEAEVIVSVYVHSSREDLKSPIYIAVCLVAENQGIETLFTPLIQKRRFYNDEIVV